MEDEAIVAMDIEFCLRGLGYEVLGPVASYEEALEQVRGRPPNLVLADIRIAGEVSGLDTAAELRARHGCPVIVLSAHSDSASRARAQAIGASGFVVKPFRPEALGQEIRRVLAEAP
ncbi:MAG: response regulator [Myxococcales bacterium]|nr:response regulator [Myxococcales bacterium]